MSFNSDSSDYEVDNLPIKMANDSDKSEIIKLVDMCLSNQYNDEIRNRINALSLYCPFLLAQLYHLLSDIWVLGIYP